MSEPHHHQHDALVHSHRHYQVTHNFLEATGGFEHLSASHDHDYDHAAVSHSHHPHERFDAEHAGEAHVHDHALPVHDGQAAAAKHRKASPKKAAPEKMGPRKAASTASPTPD